MSEVRIVGTAHVSAKSIEEVKEAIGTFSPEVVAVELDPGRYAALKKEAQDPSVAQVLETKNFTQLLVQWTLAYLQRRIGMDVGVEPGADMKAAIEEAERRGLPVALVDRDIRITLRRFWKGLSLFEKIKMLYALATSLSAIDEAEINPDELTSQDFITQALEEFRNFSPRGARALIDERDAYLAHQIHALSGTHQRVLAVLGAGHVAGVERFLADPASLPPLAGLTEEPKSRPWGTIFSVLMTAFFAILIAAIAFSGVGLNVLLWALIYWVLIHGVLTAVFTLVAGGHPLSALTGFAVSWFTALNPLIAAGWFSAIVEAKVRKPAVGDFRRIVTAETFREMWEIPMFRVVIVAALANVGSTIGTFAYFLFIFPVLQVDPVVILSEGFSNMAAAFWGLFSPAHP